MLFYFDKIRPEVVIHAYDTGRKHRRGWLDVETLVDFSGVFVFGCLQMSASADAPEPWYLALLGFAEHFRTSSPPKIRLCVHCLQAVFQFKPPARVEARTHLQLGSVLYRHTKNSELAQTHLEKAVRSQSVVAPDSEHVHQCVLLFN